LIPVKAFWQSFRDTTDIDAEEFQELDEVTFKKARDHCKNHYVRIRSLQKAEQCLKAVEAAAAASQGGKSDDRLSDTERRELYCADLIFFVNEYGVEGYTYGNRLLDLHWKIVEKYKKQASKEGVNDRNISNMVK
jgi:hypothetical protein